MRRLFAKVLPKERSSVMILLGAALLGLALIVTPMGGALERALSPLRFGMWTRSASGQVVVLEMDAKSAAAIKRWPWSRAHYAKVVDRLRAAGASSIVFDVDFSSPSDPAGDQAFAAALARADGMVVLPTFAQAAGTGDRRSIDALPIPILRQNAALASVSVVPDRDGQVRTMLFGTITADTPRPSLSAYLARRSGQADLDFPIDMSINPATLPRLSFVDVRDGRFDPALVRGRDVLIGATAIEMGDRYGTPIWGVIPGVIVQALAAETLLRGIPTHGSGTLLLLLALVASALIVSSQNASAIAGRSLVACVLLGVSVLVVQSQLLISYPMAPALSALLATAAATAIRDVVRRFSQQRRVDDATGLPNRIALSDALNEDQNPTVVTARIADYDKLQAALGRSGTADMINRIRDRISVLGGGITIYRIEDRVLAWQSTVEASQVPIRADQLRAMMLNPVEVRGRKVDVSLAIGFAAGDAGQVGEAIANAVLAADLALSTGAGWHVHESQDAVTADTELSLMSDLDSALEDGGVTVVYQPKLDLASGRITSAEALVRWNHHTRGPLRPDYFIPIVEKANRIGNLTLFVMRRAIADMTDWRSADGGIRVAINLSAVLFEDDDFIRALAGLIRQGDIDPGRLIFEVTESAAMMAPERACAALTTFRDLGITISVDDYGTGQSTLTYLKTLPLNELKIDRSFVEFAHQNRADAVLVRSTIDMAHQLGLKVVAEGVETAECLNFLRSVECDMAQGYYISRPIDAAAFKALLATPMEHAA